MCGDSVTAGKAAFTLVTRCEARSTSMSAMDSSSGSGVLASSGRAAAAAWSARNAASSLCVKCESVKLRDLTRHK